MPELVFSASYATFVVAGWLRNEIPLRIGLIVSGAGFVLFGVLTSSPSIVAWNSAFTVASIYRLARLLRADASIELSAEEERMHRSVFHDLGRREFLNLWSAGTEARLDGTVIVRQGEDPEALMLLMEGDAIVSADGRHVARLRAGQFVGEMAYVTSEPASATVTAGAGVVRARMWSHEVLEGLARRSPELAAKFATRVSADLANKLTAPPLATGG